MDQISRSMQSLDISVIDDNLTESDIDDRLTGLEDILKYDFNNKGLLSEAITHSSINSTKSYERLEFLGDSVLNYLVTKHLDCEYPEHDEGTLTLLRSRRVINRQFARVSVKHKFYQYLHLKQPDLEHLIENFVKAVEDESESESESKSNRCGDIKPPKVLADIVESIAGAVWVDSGHSADRVWEVFKPFLEPVVTSETREMHPMTELIKELRQKHGKRIHYTYVWKDNIVTVKVRMNHKVIGIGEHQQEELARRTADKQAVDELEDMLKEEERVENARRHEKGSNGHLNNFCKKNHWPSPSYRRMAEGSSYTKRFVFAVSVCTENGSTQEYVGNPMPRIKDAKNSAAKAILDALNANNFN